MRVERIHGIAAAFDALTPSDPRLQQKATDLLLDAAPREVKDAFFRLAERVRTAPLPGQIA